MSETKHTPLPWQAHGSHIYGPNRELIAQFCSDDGRLVLDMNIALEAVNNYSSLLSTVRTLAEALRNAAHQLNGYIMSDAGRLGLRETLPELKKRYPAVFAVVDAADSALSDPVVQQVLGEK